MTTVTGEIKVIKDYGVDGKHNWFTVINDAEGQEHKAYSNANLSEFAKDDIVQVQGTTHDGKKGPYIKATKFMRIGEAMNQDTTPAPPLANGTPIDTPKAKPTESTSGYTREEGMLVIGIWTRGVTSGRSSEQISSYCDEALNYYRKDENDDTPF